MHRQPVLTNEVIRAVSRPDHAFNASSRNATNACTRGLRSLREGTNRLIGALSNCQSANTRIRLPLAIASLTSHCERSTNPKPCSAQRRATLPSLLNNTGSMRSVLRPCPFRICHSVTSSSFSRMQMQRCSASWSGDDGTPCCF